MNRAAWIEDFVSLLVRLRPASDHETLRRLGDSLFDPYGQLKPGRVAHATHRVWRCGA